MQTIKCSFDYIERASGHGTDTLKRFARNPPCGESLRRKEKRTLAPASFPLPNSAKQMTTRKQSRLPAPQQMKRGTWHGFPRCLPRWSFHGLTSTCGAHRPHAEPRAGRASEGGGSDTARPLISASGSCSNRPAGREQPPSCLVEKTSYVSQEGGSKALGHVLTAQVLSFLGLPLAGHTAVFPQQSTGLAPEPQ